jgi:hypothetical protein
MRRFIAVTSVLVLTGPVRARHELRAAVPESLRWRLRARRLRIALARRCARNNADFLAFNIHDFNSITAGAEYLVGLGDYLDAGLGVGFYQDTVPSVYWDWVNDDGSEIDQDLKLRMIPFSATVRLLPFGRHGVEPYVGAGVAIINWHYSESGEFVDFTDGSVFRDTFEGSGTAVGPTILGGIRFPLGPWSVGGEIRLAGCGGRPSAEPGFRRRQGRPRRVQLPRHLQGEVLTAGRRV